MKAKKGKRDVQKDLKSDGKKAPSTSKQPLGPIAFILVIVSALAYIFYPTGTLFQGAEDSSLNKDNKDYSGNLTDADWSKWNNLISWLEKNGMPKNDLITLSYFEFSGRGVACTKDIEAETPVVTIPFGAMMTVSHARNNMKIGEVVQKLRIQLTDDAMLALFLLTEKLKPDSFWKPYMDFLPSDYSEMAIFLTPEDLKYMEGLLEPTLNYEINEFNNLLAAAKRIEFEAPEFKGITNETALKWALAAVWSRVWQIEEVGGRSLVPLADLLNHHPEKGTILVPNADEKKSTIKALQSYKKGDEFYDKYFIEKVESDGVYYATYGFLLSFNYFSTFPLDYYWMVASHENIQQLLQNLGCTGTGPQKAAVDEHIAKKGFPEKWLECTRVLAMDSLENAAEINGENYQEFYGKVEKRSLELSLKFFQEKLAGYKTGTVAEDEALLKDDKLTRNVRTLITLRKNEKLVLNNTINYLLKLLKQL